MKKISFTQGSTLINYSAGIIGFLSLLTYFRVPDNMKPLAINLIVASGSIALTNKLLSESYERSANDQLEQIINDSSSIVEDAKTQYSYLLDDNLKLTNQLKETTNLLENEKEHHRLKQLEYLAEVTSLTARLNDYKQQLNDALNVKNTLTQQLELLHREHNDLVIIEVSKSLESHYQTLKASIEHHLRIPYYVDVSNQILGFRDKFDELVAHTNTTLREIKALEDISISIEDIIDIWDRFIKLKHQWKNLLNVRERLGLKKVLELLEECRENQSQLIPVSNAQKLSDGLSQYHAQQLDKLYNQTNSITTDVNNLQNQVNDLLGQIEAKNLEIDELKNKLNTPINWRLATRDDLIIGNLIIKYFQNLGIILDRASANYKGYESTLKFHTDRNPRFLGIGELNKHSEALQQACNVRKPVTFEWDAENGLLEATIVISAKPQKSNDADINKLWKQSSQFTSIVAKWERIRITGQSQAGKSPTAENIAVCIMASRKDAGEIKLYNPQHDSRKNHFSIPVTGTSHDDSIEALGELAAAINAQSGDRQKFHLYIFDEIDSTLSSSEDVLSTANNIKAIIKQASHQNIGAIFTGQNANAKQYKGFDRSDWNNAVNVHLGSNVKDALTNSNQFSKETADKLKTQADKLFEYCQEKNSELGLEPTDPQAYRFALVIEPNKAPYFLQLPDFGQYTFDQLNVNQCPHCGSKNTIGHGANRRRCKDCGKTFEG